MRGGMKGMPEAVEAAYVTSCDVPLLVQGFVTEMIELAKGFDAAVMEIDGFPHPLSAVYRRATIAHIEDLVAHDRLRPVFPDERVNTRRVMPSEIPAD